MIDVTHKSDDGGARLQFFYLLNDRRRGLLDHDFGFVDTRSFFSLFNFEDEAMLLADRRRNIRFNRMIDSRKDVHIHEVMDELERLEANLQGEFPDDNRRFDVDDFFATLSRL